MPKKVLVIDDDESIVSFVTVGLTGAGYEVLSARDGEEGLYLVKTFKPDLIVLDLTMPRVHGFAVCQQVRADPGLAGVKIAVSTVKNYQADRDVVEKLGADAYLVKPYGLKELLETVRGLLGGA